MQNTVRLKLGAILGEHYRTLLVLYVSIFLLGFTSIAHQNNLGAVSSYIIGDSATQYGWVIGATMVGLFLGFVLSTLVSDETLLTRFVQIEVVLTLVGGASVVLAFWAYANMSFYVLFIRLITIAIAVLIGLEDALLLRIANKYEHDIAKSNGWALGLSSLGGGIAGFTFGQLLVPRLGVVNLAFVLSLVNLFVVGGSLIYFRDRLGKWSMYIIATATVFAGLTFAMFNQKALSSYLTQNLYEDQVSQVWGGVYGNKTLTCDKTGCKLFINGQIQFSSKDEYMYHELIVHPAMSVVNERVVNRPLNILVAGGGDGLVARELLGYENVGQITVVDLDPVMTGEVALEEPVVTYNEGSLLSPIVQVVNTDAFTYVRDSTEIYDLIIVDLVDPATESAAKLYSYEFYQFSLDHLSRGGVFVTQSTSPWYVPKAFWAINLTLEEVFPQVVPYRWAVPSFGDWGWNIASNIPFDSGELVISDNADWLTTEGWRASLFFGANEFAQQEELRNYGVVSTLTSPAVQVFYNESNAWDDWGE